MGTLYENIMALCESRGIKGSKLCADTGISKGLLTDLKMGRRTGVSAVTAQKIASYFDVSVAHLLGQSDVLDDIDLAFYGEYRELTEDQKQTVRDMVRVLRQRQQRE